MFEKDAEEYFENECLHSYADTEEELKEDVVPAFQKGAEFGYNKANEWHYVKDGLPKEEKKYYVYSEEWGVEVRKFLLDARSFECRNNIIIAWKEIVLPELKENE